MTADGPPGPKNEPQFLGSGAPATAADLNTLALAASRVGNRRADTAANRALATGADLWDGLSWFETDTGNEYIYDGGWTSDGGAAVAGTIGSVPASTVWDVTLERRGKRVTIEGRVYKSAGTFVGAELVGILPVGFRPLRAEVFIGALAVTTGAVWSANSAYILSSGNIQVNMQGTGSLNVIGLTASWLVP